MAKRGRKAKLTDAQLYAEYKKRMSKKIVEFTARHEKMYGVPSPNENSFITTFNAVKEGLRSRGQRLTNDRILDYMINRQAYEVARPSAIARKKFIEDIRKREGKTEKVNVKDIMKGKLDVDYEEVKKIYYMLKEDMDLKSSEAKEMISETIFGSK